MPKARREVDPEETAATSPLLEGLVGYRLRRAMTRIFADFHLTMTDLQLRPSLFAMLAIIRDNPGINQTNLGRALGIQRANLVPLIGELAARELIERRTVPGDRRAFALHLSLDGERILGDAARRVQDHEKRILSAIDLRERATLLSLLDKLGSA